jgi:predicted ATPase
MENYLTKITVKEPIRNLKIGQTIEFLAPICYIISKNGAGKSTLLEGIRQHFEIKDNSEMKYDNFDKSFAFDHLSRTEFKAKYRDAAFEDFRFSAVIVSDTSLQLKQMKSSSGQGNFFGFHGLDLKNIKKHLIILDEPEKGIDHKIQKGIARVIFNSYLSGSNQLIIATHSYLMIKKYKDYVLNPTNIDENINLVQIFDLDEWKTISFDEYEKKYFEEDFD